MKEPAAIPPISPEPAGSTTMTSTAQATPGTAGGHEVLESDGRYWVENEVGRGGLGRILKAHDRRLNRPVAIKELLTRDAGSQIRFRNEAAITARLEHPSIVPVHDMGNWTGGEPYYVMRLLSGRKDAQRDRGSVSTASKHDWPCCRTPSQSLTRCPMPIASTSSIAI